MTRDDKKDLELLAETEQLRARLDEAEDTIRAIREGEVDALIVSGPEGDQLYTIKGAEHAYRLLVEAMNEGALVLTPDGTIAYANRTFAAMLNAPLGRMVGSSIYDYMSDDGVEAVKGLLSQAGQASGRAEVSLKSYGIVDDIPAFVSVANMELDEAEVLSAVVTDLTEHKLAEAELDTYREHLEELVEQRTRELVEANRRTVSIIESIGDGFIAYDTEWRYAYINKIAEQMICAAFGCTREDLLGRGIWEHYPDIIDTDRYEDYRRAMADQTPVKFETFRKADERWYQVSAFPGVDGLSVFFEDITERKQTEHEKEELHQREQHIADVLQGTLIPQDVPRELYGCKFAVKYQPALKEAEVGGDFYDIFDLGDGRIGVLIGDVAGKGLRAAVRVAAARYTIRGYAHQGLKPAKVMTLTNSVLYRDTDECENMLTACFALIDTASNTVTYANAGHEPPVICNHSGLCDELEFSNLPLGVTAEEQYGEHERVLRPGDRIVMITDGISEARADGLRLFEKRGVIEYLTENADASPEDLIDGLLGAATAYAGGHLQDDAAVVVFEQSECETDSGCKS